MLKKEKIFYEKGQWLQKNDKITNIQDEVNTTNDWDVGTRFLEFITQHVKVFPDDQRLNSTLKQNNSEETE